MKNDIIEISIPAKPEYILVVRLAASAITTRAGMNIDDIEDFKVAIAEACISIINQKKKFKILKIIFEIDDSIKVTVSGIEIINEDSNEEKSKKQDLSQYIIDSLMDSVEFIREDETIMQIKMEKENKE